MQVVVESGAAGQYAVQGVRAGHRRQLRQGAPEHDRGREGEQEAMVPSSVSFAF